MANDPNTSPGFENPRLLIRERELAERWSTSQRTLQRWRAEGKGPAYILIGGAIRYRMADIADFEDRMRCGGGKP
ncbi:helix-turn-helix domain-containing protein [Palleronia marisminoris]|uniref:helix-turn-helix domain-containing protein n=1 Tax=Palleronia marisminoris TaxID=315423 RepID=UPI000A26EA4B|nr:helix-turn-helix domain-containing protein [Palleronia marisminoris]